MGDEAASNAAPRQANLARHAVIADDTVLGAGMTLETTDKAAETGKTIVSDNDKLFPEVMKLVKSMRGGASGLLQQFEDKGLGHVASSMTSKGGTRMISSQQLSHGLGTVQIEWLAAASGLDARVVRKELVMVLPMVLEELSSEPNTVERVQSVV